ncbi:peptidoglycan -binding protein [Marinibaculum pumilum]|uniref:Peptidoglycan -binding protein n=1 Tax=Marinibaculum pumilum TaxID=1766165 RepID=A0ABV7L7E1_9PROT
MSRSRSGRRQIDAWPGFVDVLSTLLLVIVFVLVVYVLAQFFLAQAITGKDKALDRLNREIAEITDLLSLEREENSRLRTSLDEVSRALEEAIGERDRLTADLRGASDTILTLRSQLADAEERASQQAGVIRMLEDSLGSAETLLAQNEQDLAQSRDLIVELRDTIDSLRDERRRLEAESTAQGATLASRDAALARESERLERARASLEQRQAELDAVEARLRTRLSQLARVEAALRAREAELAAEKDRADALQLALARRIAAGAQSEAALEAAREELSEAEIRMTDQEIDIAAAQERTTELEGLLVSERLALEKERKLTDAQRSQLDLLNQQLAVLRQEMARLNLALDAAEAKDRESQAQIADLGRRLNRALAAKVEELSRYRSEFFGRLREALGRRADVQVVGDRFVLQSEILFASGSADIGPEGKRELRTLAETLLDIAKTIPPDLNWILRVDGHTDAVPINNLRYRSNWDLSAARALAVTDYLIEQGVPPARLAAAGFGEYHPLPGTNATSADPRNRRIEFKLTER